MGLRLAERLLLLLCCVKVVSTLRGRYRFIGHCVQACLYGAGVFAVAECASLSVCIGISLHQGLFVLGALVNHGITLSESVAVAFFKNVHVAMSMVQHRSRISTWYHIGVPMSLN